MADSKTPKLVAGNAHFHEDAGVETAFHCRAIWISIVAVGLFFADPLQRVAAQTPSVEAAQTGRIENVKLLTTASNVAITPRRIIADDPPPRELSLKKRARTIVSFGLLVITLLILIVGIGILRAFRQR